MKLTLENFLILVRFAGGDPENLGPLTKRVYAKWASVTFPPSRRQLRASEVLSTESQQFIEELQAAVTQDLTKKSG
jgi:hypothetical protein